MKTSSQLGKAGQEAIKYIEQLVLVFIGMATVYATFDEIYKRGRQRWSA